MMDNPYSGIHYHFSNPEIMSEETMYDSFAESSMSTLNELFQLVQTIGVYLTLFGLIAGALLLMYTKSSNMEKASQNKKQIIRIIGVVICIFGIVGILSLVASTAIKR